MQVVDKPTREDKILDLLFTNNIILNVPQNQKLIDVSLDHNLEQVVDKPTRENKIIDLLFTNNKSSLQKIEILPGIGKSDHKIVFAEIDTQPCRISKPKRNIFLYRKADWDGIKFPLY